MNEIKGRSVFIVSLPYNLPPTDEHNRSMVLPSGMNSATDLLDQDKAKCGLASLGQILI